jgi:hypothetical protein
MHRPIQVGDVVGPFEIRAPLGATSSLLFKLSQMTMGAAFPRCSRNARSVRKRRQRPWETPEIPPSL